MPIVRAGGVLLCAAAATTLAGCAGSRLSPDAPAGVNLAGAWKLNRSASDDPQKVLNRMRAEAFNLPNHVNPSIPGKCASMSAKSNGLPSRSARSMISSPWPASETTRVWKPRLLSARAKMAALASLSSTTKTL